MQSFKPTKTKGIEAGTLTKDPAGQYWMLGFTTVDGERVYSWQKQNAVNDRSAKNYTVLDWDSVQEKVTLDMGRRTPTVPKKEASLRYPDTIKDSMTDYVLFEFGKYKPPYSSASALSSRSKYDGYMNSANIDTRSTDLSPIILYMPQDISSDIKQNWNGKSVSNIGRAALKAKSGNINAGDYNVTQGLRNALDSAIAGTLNMIPGVGGNLTLNDVTSSTRGVIINPNVEILFDSPELREFSLKFKMTPHDPGEAASVRAICNTFRKASLPVFNSPSTSYTDTNGKTKDLVGGLTIGVPKMCKVNFMMGSGLHPWLPQYKTCAITKVSVNYAPDGVYATFEDGSPVATELQVSFLETKLVFAEEITVNGASY